MVTTELMSFPQTYFKTSKLTRNMKQKIELNGHKFIDVNKAQRELITRKRTGKMFLDDLVHKVEQGLIAPEFATLQLKQLVKQFKSTELELEELTKEALVGIDHYVWGDYKITRREGSTTFDFSECEEIVAMEKHTKELKNKYKKAYEGVESGVTITLEGHKFVDNNGEVLTLPKKKYNKSSIVLTKV